MNISLLSQLHLMVKCQNGRLSCSLSLPRTVYKGQLWYGTIPELKSKLVIYMKVVDLESELGSVWVELELESP